MVAKHVMSQPFAVCQAFDTLNQAAKLMWDADCGVIPIVDNEGRAVAMLTDRDIYRAASAQGKRLHEIPVHTAMSKVLVACQPRAPLQQVEQLMMEHQIRWLPVLDEDGRPVGILSFNDLVRMANSHTPLRPAAEAESRRSA